MNEKISDAEKLRKSYFDDFPFFLKDSPKFFVKADERSGRIPCARIEHWQDFSRLLNDDFFKNSSKNLVFRGQRRHDWSLMPTLARLTDDGIVTRDLAEKQLHEFKRAIRGRLSDYSIFENEDELWSVGQHHGLMTPLLDWTTSPYVALFFAFEQPDNLDEKDNEYRVVYVLDKKFIENYSEESGIRVIEPEKDYYGRLVNQAGLFTHPPFNNTIESQLATILADGDALDDEELLNADHKNQPDILAKYLCKILIPNIEREEILKHLRLMNVHHASLFPDLIGASDHCNAVAEEYVVNEKLRKIHETTRTAAHTSDQINDVVKVSDEFIEPQQETLNLKLSKWPASKICDEIIADAIISSFAEKYPDNQKYPLDLANNLSPLTYFISKLEITDWHIRESAIAQMRTAITLFLRQQRVSYDDSYALGKEITKRLIKARSADVEITG